MRGAHWQLQDANALAAYARVCGYAMARAHAKVAGQFCFCFVCKLLDAECSCAQSSNHNGRGIAEYLGHEDTFERVSALRSLMRDVHMSAGHAGLCDALC